MISEIGQPINQPQILDLRVRPARGIRFAALMAVTKNIVRRHLVGLGGLSDDLIDGSLTFDRWRPKTASRHTA